MLTSFISPGDPCWATALSAVQCDVYALPEYVKLCAEYENARPAAFFATDKGRYCLIPLVLRPLPGRLGVPHDWLDAVSPYGYGSAIFHGDAGWASAAVGAMVQACRERNVVTAFIRLHPLLPPPPEALTAVGKCVWHGQTVPIDLTLSECELDKQTRTNHRVGIRRLRQMNFTTVIDDWSLYDEYVTVYQQTMARLNAEPYYYFNRKYFLQLRSALRDRLHLCCVLAPDKSVAAAGLFTAVNGIVEYHLGGTADSFRNAAPSKLMIYAARVWAKSLGKQVLHLGGGYGGREDSLFHFKSGFSKLRAAFGTWRIVFDQRKYATLVNAPASGGLLVPEFFPEYRKPDLVCVEAK